jgi:hypothetical protein
MDTSREIIGQSQATFHKERWNTSKHNEQYLCVFTRYTFVYPLEGRSIYTTLTCLERINALLGSKHRLSYVIVVVVVVVVSSLLLLLFCLFKFFSKEKTILMRWVTRISSTCLQYLTRSCFKLFLNSTNIF